MSTPRPDRPRPTFRRRVVAAAFAIVLLGSGTTRAQEAATGALSEAPAVVASGAGHVARIPQSEDAPLARTLAQLVEPRRLETSTLDALSNQVAALEPGAIQTVFAYLCGTLPPPIPEGATMPKEGTPSFEDVFFAALHRWNPRLVAAHVSAAVSGEPNLGPRLVAWRVLAECGGAGGYAAWEEITAPVPGNWLGAPSVRNGCRAALEAVLRRDAESLDLLARRYGAIAPALRSVACDALANTGRAAGTRVLLAALPALDRAPAPEELAALDALAHLVETTTGDLLEEDLVGVRALARHPDARVRRSTLILLGRVFDVEGHTTLTDGLGDSDEAVRAAAEWALTWIALEDLGGEPEAWTRWFRDQLAWREEQMPKLSRALEIRVAGPSIEAARTLSERPWFRHGSARAVATLVDGGDAEIVRQACIVLRELRSPAAIPFLLEGLTSEDEAVRDAVRGTLVALTGRDLPADPAAWQSAGVGP